MPVLWGLTAVAAVVGALILALAVLQSGAPQVAAWAAVGIGVAVLPYVFTRALQGIFAGSDAKRRERWAQAFADAVRRPRP